MNKEFYIMTLRDLFFHKRKVPDLVKSPGLNEKETKRNHSLSNLL